jgi:hypothetical protein
VLKEVWKNIQSQVNFVLHLGPAKRTVGKTLYSRLNSEY